MKIIAIFISISLITFMLCNCHSPGDGDQSIPRYYEINALCGDWLDSALFGSSVAISGDSVIVGACGEENWRGAVYIYYNNQVVENNWGKIKKIIAPDTVDDDHFGNAVAISGDYAMVGVQFNDAGFISNGAAYMFYRNAGGADQWGEVKRLTASDAKDNDYFGCSVALYGDYGIVGARDEDGDGNNRGAAYIFYRNAGGADQWGEVKKLTASDAEDDTNFGISVAINGDYAMVGAYRKDNARGAVYVFYRNADGSENWGQIQKILGLDSGDFLGGSIAMSGDFAIVGASDRGPTNSGRAYIYINFGFNL
jgi:hypothetical protein